MFQSDKELIVKSTRQRVDTTLCGTCSRTLLAIVTSMWLHGCGGPLDVDYSQLNLAEVSGTVTLDDKPLAGARVSFEAPDQTYSYGITDSAGEYTLMFNSEKSGVTPGKKTVRIVMGGALDEAESEDVEDPDSDEPSAASDVTIPERYNRKSTLTETVEPGNQTFDFKLKSAP